jgi:hypothetical protein
MAYSRIRSASIFWNGTKIGYIEGIDYNYTTGDEAQFGDPGYVGHTDGAGTTKIKADGIIPIPGIGIDVYGVMLRRETVGISLGLVNGKIHSIDMRCVSMGAQGSQKAGTLKGTIDLEGGEPSLS